MRSAQPGDRVYFLSYAVEGRFGTVRSVSGNLACVEYQEGEAFETHPVEKLIPLDGEGVRVEFLDHVQCPCGMCYFRDRARRTKVCRCGIPLKVEEVRA